MGNKAISTLVFGSLVKGTEEMLNDLLVTVREKIGPIATPDYIQNAPGLPKTRSGMFSEASRDWVWDWARPTGGVVCVDGSLFGRAGVGQCYYQVTRRLWSPRENHEAGASEDCSE